MAEMRQSELNLGLFILMRNVLLSGNHNTVTHYRHLAFYIQMLQIQYKSIQVNAIIIYIRISLLYNGILVTPLTQLTQKING